MYEAGPCFHNKDQVKGQMRQREHRRVMFGIRDHPSPKPLKNQNTLAEGRVELTAG